MTGGQRTQIKWRLNFLILRRWCLDSWLLSLPVGPRKSASFIPCQLPLTPFREFSVLKVGSRVEGSFPNAPSPSQHLWCLWRQAADTQLPWAPTPKVTSGCFLSGKSHEATSPLVPGWLVCLDALGSKGEKSQISLTWCRLCWSRMASPLQEHTLMFQILSQRQICKVNAGNSSDWD